MRGDGLYSRVIAWLKVVLPLAALALLSTLFLFSSGRDPLENVPFADTLEGGGTILEGVAAPQYSGTTQSGDLLTMTAERARPLQGGDIAADALVAQLRMKDGSAIDLTATLGTLRNGERRIHLDQGVIITNSLGYRLETQALVSDIDRTAAESLAPVQGEGPLGTLEAGKMQILPADADGAVQMLFTGGVKLIYQPPAKDNDP
ncbi:LPS export ABC transporter periplasmic protein LptC [Sagittula salina]|uniref:LPS export ABC transporter periplasmic protein LptC n=1 Tax=Sagittula salina TaxID=2820268 RepID=A0A940S3S5_9RHOB|nr:LPS export ABC transporter periplasmic protein LptC [Sagittula salina]MBP0483110.1 LPS export ABC transporter periplasmic protein LptC [Sagittula salina]